MKDDFQHLEDDMTHLSSRMEEIISSSNSINSSLSDRKREITKLCGVHHLLKKVCIHWLWGLGHDKDMHTYDTPHTLYSFSSCLNFPLDSTSVSRWDSMDRQ